MSASLILAGLLLRLPGVLFNGMADLYQMLLDWGLSVWHRGLVAAFGINYGVLSYAALGPLAGLGERVPRYWWAPYKLAVIGLEALVLSVLLRRAAQADRRQVVLLYWLNPWFILHGAYYGFWEAPHLLAALLAVSALAGDRARTGRAWAVAGAWLAVSGLFKPQGLVYFAAPLAFYLAFEKTRGLRRPLGSFLAGWAAVVLAATTLLRGAGGSWVALYENYRSAFTTMGGISNGGPGIWRVVAFAIMRSEGLDGPVHALRLSRPVLAVLSTLAGLVCLVLLAAFALKVRMAPSSPERLPGPPARNVAGERSGGATAPSRSATRFGLRPSLAALERLVGPPVVLPPDQAVLSLFAFAALVISQFGVRAHINHSYTAMVLLVPLAAQDRRVRRIWAAMCALLGLAHVVTFGLGEATVLPLRSLWARYPEAAGLIEAVGRPAADPGLVLKAQTQVRDWLQAVPGQEVISISSLAVFAGACWLTRALLLGPTAQRRLG